ncbi:hypothetical protein [Streptomyces sp. NPDC060198]|uniref:hypothetical protein n=1 Tax=Streptomyces sp. NPDC060198 TaxID=3347070 RepID=UPI00365AA179
MRSPRAADFARPPADDRPLLSDRSERRFLESSRRRGRKAAKSGALDSLVLQSDDRIPYLSELASVRDRVIRKIEGQALRAEEEAAYDDAYAGTEAERLRQETLLIDRRLSDAQEQIDTTRGQLDVLALRAGRWLRFRDSIRARLEERWMRSRFPDLSPPEPAPRGADAGQGQRAQPGPGPVPDGDWVTLSAPAPVPPRPADGAEAGAADEIGMARAWEGLHKRPGIPPWMTWGLLGAILAVEIPIYWVAFQPFHGVGQVGADLMSGTLAVSAAVVMVVLPHLAGHVLRRRPETGSVRHAWFPALTLLGAWGGLACVLGTLRAKFVTQGGEAEEGVPGFADPTRTDSSLVDRLDLAPHTVLWLFCGLLLLSGGIGFLLGLCREHPHLNAYRTAVERRLELRGLRERSIAATDRARAWFDSAETRRAERQRRTEQHVLAVRDLYESGAYSYLDGVSMAAADPAVTEAAMRLSAKWPLLPATTREIPR